MLHYSERYVKHSATANHVFVSNSLTLSVRMLAKVDIRGRVLKATKVDFQGSSAVT